MTGHQDHPEHSPIPQTFLKSHGAPAAVGPSSHPLVSADVGLSPLGWLTARRRLNSASKAAEDIAEGARDEFLHANHLPVNVLNL